MTMTMIDLRSMLVRTSETGEETGRIKITIKITVKIKIKIGRDRIVAATAPGMATGNPFQGQPGSGQCAVGLNGFERIEGATWGESATAQRPANESFGGRKHPPIKAHAND